MQAARAPFMHMRMHTHRKTDFGSVTSCNPFALACFLAPCEALSCRSTADSPKIKLQSTALVADAGACPHKKAQYRCADRPLQNSMVFRQKSGQQAKPMITESLHWGLT